MDTFQNALKEAFKHPLQSDEFMRALTTGGIPIKEATSVRDNLLKDPMYYGNYMPVHGCDYDHKHYKLYDQSLNGDNRVTVYGSSSDTVFLYEDNEDYYAAQLHFTPDEARRVAMSLMQAAMVAEG